MPDFTVIEARQWHCGQICRILRAEQQSMVTRLGLDAHRELRARFDESTFRRAWLIDGALAGIYGVTGGMLDTSGLIWIALSKQAIKYQIQMIKLCREELANITETKRLLYAIFPKGDQASLRFAIFFGFVLDDGQSEVAETKFGRRDMLQRCEAYGDIIPLIYDSRAA